MVLADGEGFKPVGYERGFRMVAAGGVGTEWKLHKIPPRCIGLGVQKVRLRSPLCCFSL